MADAVTKHSHAAAHVVLGVPSVLSSNTSAIAAAVQAAALSDEVILAVGTDLTWAHEEHDAQNITFTDAQSSLISAVAQAAKKPVVLCVYTATPLDLTHQIANPKIGAIVHVGQPSVNIVGLGELLFGHKSPAGRMVQTVYPASYADEVSIFDFNMRPGPAAFPRPDCKGGCGKINGTNPGRTHRFYTGKPVVPFGFGLSYTTFTYTASASAARVSLAPVRSMLDETYATGRTFPKAAYTVGGTSPLVSYFVNVSNTGTMDADDVVLGFLVPPNAGHDGTPLQTLFAFERVHVKAGATVRVNMYPALNDFALTLLDGTKRAVEGEWTVKFGVQEAAKHGQGYAEVKLTTF
jgi:hypothetical protein